MELNDIIDAISRVGFPVVAVYFLWKRSTKQDDFFAAQYKELKTAINNNTEVIKELITRIKEG